MVAMNIPIIFHAMSMHVCRASSSLVHSSFSFANLFVKVHMLVPQAHQLRQTCAEGVDVSQIFGSPYAVVEV